MATINFSQYFPDYEILTQIGLANARVLKARHRATGELVAIKHYPINADEETLARFQRESQIMTQVDHPNVVKIREVHLDASLPYIVMDYIQGGDVRSLLRMQGSLEVPTVIQLGQQMAEALREIHEKGIIHRDIKPDNILYQKMSNGQLHFLLTDFGISRLRESQDATITGQSPMTPEYASPEQFDDSRKVSFAADYYSLGVVLYECLEGRVPFSMGTLGIVSFYKVLEKEAPPKIALSSGVSLPESMECLMQELLEKDPSSRLSNSKQLRFALMQAIMQWEGLGADASNRRNYSNKDEELLKRAEECEVKKDYVNALNLYSILAEKGNSNAQLKLGLMYRKGLGIEQNDEIAFKWYNMSANQGNALAQQSLGYMYQYGLGIELNYSLALEWYHKSAQQMNAAAQNNIGYMYQNGLGVRQDYGIAFQWFSESAKQGQDCGQYNLGYMYENGLGIQRNQHEALRLYNLAANQGNVSALKALKYFSLGFWGKLFGPER